MRKAKIKLVDLIIVSNRAYGGEGDINILAEDIKQNGIINDVTVKPSKTEGKYDVVAGRRRVGAMLLLKWEDAPCNILETEEEISKAEAIAGSENINRMAMHPLDEAVVFQKLLDNGSTIEDLAKQYDRKVSAIWQRIQLLTLNNDIKTFFRNGNLSLHSAAMLRSLNETAQKSFVAKFKTNWAVKEGKQIDDEDIECFIDALEHDRLYGFLRDEQCSKCKTRTFFSDKTLFPELDNANENCFNHECYQKKMDKALANGINSLNKKSHANCSLILVNKYGGDFQHLIGKELIIDEKKYKVLPEDYQHRASASDKDAVPCYYITISREKLDIQPQYWVANKSSSSSSINKNAGSAEKRKKLSPIVNLLDIPEEEKKIALDAMNNSKRISEFGLKQNVRESAFWRIIETKAEEFNDPKKLDQNAKEIFVLKHFSKHFNGNDKKIFEQFAGKKSIEEIAKMPSEKIFALICALEWDPWGMPDPGEMEKKEYANIMKWIGATAGLKTIYQEEIRKRIPKTKPEEKKQAKPKAAADKPAENKKPAKKKLPDAKRIKQVNAAKAKTVKKAPVKKPVAKGKKKK